MLAVAAWRDRIAFAVTVVTAAALLGLVSVGDVFGATEAYVANQSSNNVSVIDVATQTVVATIAVGSAPRSVTASASRVYVANSGTGTVSVIDPSTHTVVSTITVRGDLEALPPNAPRTR